MSYRLNKLCTKDLSTEYGSEDFISYVPPIPINVGANSLMAANKSERKVSLLPYQNDKAPLRPREIRSEKKSSCNIERTAVSLSTPCFYMNYETVLFIAAF